MPDIERFFQTPKPVVCFVIGDRKRIDEACPEERPPLLIDEIRNLIDRAELQLVIAAVQKIRRVQGFDVFRCDRPVRDALIAHGNLD